MAPANVAPAKLEDATKVMCVGSMKFASSASTYSELLGANSCNGRDAELLFILPTLFEYPPQVDGNAFEAQVKVFCHNGGVFEVGGRE